MIAKRELDFVGIKDVKQDDIVSSVRELFKQTFKLISVRKKIGDQKQKAPSARELGESSEVFGECGGALWDLFDGLGEWEEVRGLAFGWEKVLLLAIEGEKSDGIALAQQEVGKGKGERSGVVVFGGSAFAVFGMLGVVHGSRGIEQDVSAQVGFVFKLLDVVAITFGKEFPVDMADLVAGGVLFVFGEFDALAVVRALVESCEGSFDIAQGFEGDGREFGEDVGIEKGGTTHPFFGPFGLWPLVGPFGLGLLVGYGSIFAL